MSLDYRPDTPFAPNVFNTLAFVMPDKAGNYRTPYSATACGWPNLHISLASAVKGSRMVQYADGTPNWFLGNSTKLYELSSSGTMSDVSRTVGGAYTGSNRWWFCQFGDSTIASNLTDATQVRTSSVTGTAFAALSNAPKARFFLSQSGYLLACGYDDGTSSPNGIKWATEGSTTTWTATTGNTANNTLLRQTPGQIVAGAEIRDIVAIWKKNSMYVGRVIGGSGTSVWQFNLLSPKIGCASQEAWAATPVGIIFVSPNNGIYRFDGSVPIPIDRGIRQAFYRNIGTTSSVQMTHDEATQSVYIWIGGTVCWTYNYACDKWGIAYSSGTLGNTSYTTMVCGVRDANYDDFITLGGTTDGNRRCHLVWSSEKDVCNLNALAAGTGIDAVMSILSVRDPKAGADDLTQLERVAGVYVYDAEDTGFTGEPASSTMTATPRARGGGGQQALVTANYDSAHTRWDLNVTGNTIALAWAHTAQKFILNDLLFNTERRGQA